MKIVSILLLLLTMVNILGCNKNDGIAPASNSLSVQTGTAVTPTQISAAVTGTVTAAGASSVTSRGFCWNTSPNPVYANNRILVGSGTGSFNTTITGLSYNTTYYLRAFAINSSDTAYGPQVSFITQPISIAGGGVTDIDGNTYTTVILGGKEWMVQNLKVTKYRNGDAIPNITDNTAWLNTGTGATGSGAWCYYTNTPGLNNTFGKLYNFYAVADARQLAPTGWHIPNKGDYQVLSSYLGGDNLSGGALKVNTADWQSPNTGASNSTGFSALPGGDREVGGFKFSGASGFWWTSNDRNYVKLSYADTKILFQNTYTGETGMSVRCVKD